MLDPIGHNETCFKTGKLLKQGGIMKIYRTRLFVLYYNRITYHSMDYFLTAKYRQVGEISLRDLEPPTLYEMTEFDPKRAVKYGFVVGVKDKSSMSRNYYLFTETREECLEWIQAIRQVVEMCRMSYFHFCKMMKQNVGAEQLHDITIKTNGASDY